MQGVLKDVDHQPLASDPDLPRWRNTAQWARAAMVREGLIKGDSRRGIWEIKGIAWSGRGFIETVEVSTDGGRSWALAKLEQPVLPIAHTRFRFLWEWDGSPTTIMSRATDSTGYIQPSRQELIDLRGFVRGPTLEFSYHANYMQPWRVDNQGNVTNGLV